MKKKCDAFGMKTIYHNRKELSNELAGGAKYVTFDELLAQADVLSLNLPLNVGRLPYVQVLIEANEHQNNTRHIISTAEFAKMKKSVVIVNTARGAVMDEDALVKALESGQVLSCGLDVFEEEPKIHPGLIGNPNVMLLPHMGTWSLETMIAMEEWCIGNVRSALETGTLKSPVPEHTNL